MVTLDQTQGCLLGLSLGDAFGAPYEGGFFERGLWRVMGRTQHGERRWTDDTQMTLDVVDSFLANGRIDPDDLAVRFARSYHWSRGYGSGAAKVLKRISAGMDWREANLSVYRHGSYGNGAAMRAPIIGLIYSHRPDELPESAKMAAIVTHVHPLAIEGALLIAQATSASVRGGSTCDILELTRTSITHAAFATRFEIARSWIQSGEAVSVREVVEKLGNGIAAHASCVTALYLALRFRDHPFTHMLQFICRCGGDADSIGAMAGALWGAANGYRMLPAHWLEELEENERTTKLAESLHRQLMEVAGGH